jgi:hypothetical protein
MYVCMLKLQEQIERLPQAVTLAVLFMVCRNNTSFGGSGMHLRDAAATFASTIKTVLFVGNTGNYGPAVKVHKSSIVFNGPVVVADNRSPWGAGGAFDVELSDVTFNGTATFRNNSLGGCTMVSDM